MLTSNFERFVKMCKCRLEREFKDEAQCRGVRLRENPSSVGEAVAAVARPRFPHSRHLKLGMPPAHFWKDRQGDDRIMC